MDTNGIFQIVRRRPTAVYLGLILLFIAGGALWLFLKGPTSVLRGSVQLKTTAPFAYMLSAFPFLGMLAAEALALLARGRHRQGAALITACAVLILISHLRVQKGIPLSGHAMLFAYLLARRALHYRTATLRQKLELVTAGVALLTVTYIKLACWADPLTLAVGIAAGVLILAVERLIER